MKLQRSVKKKNAVLNKHSDDTTVMNKKLSKLELLFSLYYIKLLFNVA